MPKVFFLECNRFACIFVIFFFKFVLIYRYNESIGGIEFNFEYISNVNFKTTAI